MGVRIALVAGEASGDLLAAHLIAALRARLPDLHCAGIGGPKMEAVGFEAWWPYDRLAVHGYVDALKRYRELSGVRRALLKRLLDDPPDVFIGVDAPDFNLWLEQQLRRRGVCTVHFVSPSIWAWRGGRIKRIRTAVDHMLCLFPFEPAIYDAAGVPATYVGHPLADTFPLEPDQDEARERLQLPPQAPVFALLPGSRESEVANLAPLFIETAKYLLDRYPAARFLVPLATRETRVLFEKAQYAAEAHDLPLSLLFGHAVDAMTAADVVLVASGTASLEAALLKRPMVIAYRMGALQYRLMKRMAYLPWVGLPNILCRESVVPEMLQDNATPAALGEALARWFDDADARRALAERFTELHHTLRQDTAQRAADVILPLIGASRDS
ncbi:lipid-A-disaccharide synthase [Denitromonas iodatirespirans]|uniref:Lipid-A-disaccharide synthase n=1 Tax=Denitromonas iodatirespirans TaxID=2795389 RepID=A0A944D8A2_DENI1|nr:lipid-A-disaccharide synthase [Denitromonas iodatirespirans]MBT0960171.1 lipid-A-disaccharide synthase [Denitromonas iodatirespirans]